MRWSCWSFSVVEQCPLLQVCVCVCALGWVKCREHISLLVILCIIVYVTKKKNVFFQNQYPIMVKCLNIGKNIGKPIYRSISNTNVKYICQDDWQDTHSIWLMNFLFHDLQFLEWRRISKNHFESDRHTNETFRMIPDWLKRMIGRFYSEFVKCYFSIVYMIL